MQQFLTAASPFCVYDEWCTRCKSGDTCPDIPVWMKNGVASHSYIGHCLEALSMSTHNIFYREILQSNFHTLKTSDSAFDPSFSSLPRPDIKTSRASGVPAELLDL